MSRSGPRFLADEMLGKLARDLRALGYDVVYIKHVDDDEILDRARADDRLLITRDQNLSHQAGDRGVLVEPRDPTDQLEDLVRRLELEPSRERFLTRCLECNAEIEPTRAPEQVPDAVREDQHWRCPGCGKLYWLGTHAQDMLDRLGGYLAEDRASQGDEDPQG